MCPQYPITIGRPVNRSYTFSSLVICRKSNVNAKPLPIRWSCLVGDGDLDDFSILTKVGWTSEGIQEGVFSSRRVETSHVDEVLLYYAQTREMFSIQALDLTLLRLFLSLFGFLFCILLDVRLKSCYPAQRVSIAIDCGQNLRTLQA
jgi:hypothetical protein